MMEISQKIGIPWETLGISQKPKLFTFKSGFSRIIKKDFSGMSDIEDLTLMGGVKEPGTHLWWQTNADITRTDSLCTQYTTYFSFASYLLSEKKLEISSFVKKLLTIAAFKYGIVFEMVYAYSPNGYAFGGIIDKRSNQYPRDFEKDDLIRKWMDIYASPGKAYRTGLLRDVYPHNILVDTHLNERVGHMTLDAWIQRDPTRGTLEKITDTHYLWSINPADIPPIQEALQDAGLLLCYKL
jgi:hypothetical protein